MKIVDIEGKEIKACFVFDYCGYEISCSTIALGGQVAIFKGNNMISTCWNVASAMEEVRDYARADKIRQRQTGE